MIRSAIPTASPRSTRSATARLAAGGALIAIAACGVGSPSTDETAQPSDPTGAAAETQAQVKPSEPELGAFGVEIAAMNPSVAAGDDFYRHVNGAWLDTFQIPDEYSSYGSFTVLFERSEDRVRAIIEEAATSSPPAGSTERKIGDFFSSYTDVEAIEATGLAVLADDLDAIDALETRDAVAVLMSTPERGAATVVGAYMSVDAKRPDRYAIYLSQSGLGLPNRDYYLEEKFADKKAAYEQYVATMLDLADVDGAAEKAAAILALETTIAQAHWSPAKRRNRDLTYNLKDRAALKDYAPQMPWDAMFDAAGIGDREEVVLREDDAIQKIAEIFAETPVDLWKDYLRFHLIRSNADVLPRVFDAANFAFYGTTLRGTEKQRERWKRGVAAVNGALGEAVGQVYVERHFPSSSKDMMVELVANLRRALDQRLDTLAWMGAETKEEAHAKLDKFTPKIGYPDQWKDYSELEVQAGDPYGNKRRANVWDWRQDLKKLDGPIDRTEWFMNPQTVNAYYSPTRNEIVFPAAILQAPFFDPNADPAVNYGGIGAVIGHEIGHGFDDQGRKSDGNGRLRDWWTDEDAANFQELTDALGSQYGEYEPVDGFKVNPILTRGENIGDLGGLAMAYHAYKLSLDGEAAPVINGTTGDQRFFMAWAQVWKRVVREEALKNQVATDPHAPAQYRVNGVVRNMDAWYDAFGVGPENAMYLPPEDRVSIW
ncbi:MAG: M13 family metallopeptidase [Pseudomonadota bacterium]